MNTEGDPFVTYRRRKSRYTGEFEDIQLEDISSNMEQTCIHSDRVKGTREEEDRMEFRNLVSALQDLAKGQKDLLNAINRLSTKPEIGINSTPPSPVDRGLQAAVERLRTPICRTLRSYIADLPTTLPCLTSWQIQ